ncbi:MAG: mechanosensitive ion channel family protein [Panacagrimonas sp.]
MIPLPHNWVLTGLTVLGIGAGLSFIVEYLARTLDEGRFGWQRSVRRRLGVAPENRIAELRWVTLALQLTIWPLLGYILLRLWGLDELGRAFVDKLLGEGFMVGSTKIAPGKLVLGLLAFLLLVTFTRWFKGKLERDWLPMTRLEPSVRMSVATLYGYATFVIAVLVGLSAAGLDLSRIAIVAGALSVGIGFGLQNIVNNFVSGLILLFERPVRLGDYIKVGNTEGFVRQIRIRSTELENGDHISIIVPNSALLSAEVENWNYRNSLGRVIVSVGVNYGVEPGLVKQLLLEIADEHPLVIKSGERMDVPGPFVVFKDFGDSSLVFEIRACIADIYSKLVVASDLRFAIHSRFKQRGIDMPFPQRDVWIRNPHEVGRPVREAGDDAGPSEEAE